MELIDKAKLYNAIAELEDKATDNFLKESQASQHKLVYMGELGELRGITTIKYLVADFPTVEPPKGEWKKVAGEFVCSHCNLGYNNQPTLMGKPMFEFCPCCGARMKVWLWD